MTIRKSGVLASVLFLSINLQNVLAQQALTFGALGDSITTAMNTSGWGDQPQDSWSTGDNP